MVTIQVRQVWYHATAMSNLSPTWSLYRCGMVRQVWYHATAMSDLSPTWSLYRCSMLRQVWYHATAMSNLSPTWLIYRLDKSDIMLLQWVTCLPHGRYTGVTWLDKSDHCYHATAMSDLSPTWSLYRYDMVRQVWSLLSCYCKSQWATSLSLHKCGTGISTIINLSREATCLIKPASCEQGWPFKRDF